MRKEIQLKEKWKKKIKRGIIMEKRMHVKNSIN